MMLNHALLIGRGHNLAWTLPQLLARAGFSVDVISSSRVMQHARFVRECDIVPRDASIVPAIRKRLEKHYDWIVITEDDVLNEILQSNLSLEDKLKALPVLSQENLIHLFSKIGLFKTFSTQGVSTPPSFPANHLPEALLAAKRLGYPVLLKLDASSGGAGVFECKDPSALGAVYRQVGNFPILVQKKLFGIELDLSALYLEGELVHFSFAKVEKTVRSFGPSSLRTYYPLSILEKSIFQELEHIGKVLGAHGFVNIACIQSEQGRFYFEADMRPNVWVEFPKFFGEDPAVRIKQWFCKKKKLEYPALPSSRSPILLPYFLRLKRWELLCNRYGVWKFIPKDDLKLTLKLLSLFLCSFGIRTFIRAVLRKMRYWGP